MQLTEIEEAIKAQLIALGREATRKNFVNETQWTVALKRRLVGLSRRFKCQTRTSRSGDNALNEWLYDVVWVKEDGDRIRDVVLVLESEWKQRDAEYDFDKLLLARARHRVMVFTAYKREGPGGSIERLLSRISACSLSRRGDRYLIAAWENWHREFSFKTYVYRGAD